MAYKLDFTTLKKVTIDEAFQFILDTAKGFGFPTTSFESGSIGYSILRTTAVIVSLMSESIYNLAQSIYLDTASDYSLDLIGTNHFSEDRKLATKTILKPVLYNTGIQELTFAKDTLKFQVFKGVDIGSGNNIYVEFSNDDTVVIQPGPAPDGYNSTASFSSLTFGSQTRVSQQILPIFNPPQAFLSFSKQGLNANDGFFLVVTEGQDKETNESYRDRCRKKWASLSANGPEDAYIYWASQAKLPNGDAISITRKHVDKDTANMLGIVNIYFADEVGGKTEEELTAINDNIQLHRAIGATIVVSNATEISANYAMNIYHNINNPQVNIKDLIYQALVKFVGSVEIGGTKSLGGFGYIFASEIIDTIMNIDGIVDVKITSVIATPRGTNSDKDIILESHDVIILSEDLQKASMTLYQV